MPSEARRLTKSGIVSTGPSETRLTMPTQDFLEEEETLTMLKLEEFEWKCDSGNAERKTTRKDWYLKKVP